MSIGTSTSPTSTFTGTFYYLCAVLDGASRYLVAWSLRESMTEAEVEILLQRAKEKFPEARPRIISDNGPQFIAKDFKEFIRISGMTHVRTSPYYPQSNGKMERWNKSIKSESIRPGVPLSVEDAEHLITQYVQVYNRAATAQRDRLCHAAGDAGGTSGGDPCRAGSQVGRSSWASGKLRRQQTASRFETHRPSYNDLCQVKRKRALRGRNHAEG